jgi:hypothetical protein
MIFADDNKLLIKSEEELFLYDLGEVKPILNIHYQRDGTTLESNEYHYKPSK